MALSPFEEWASIWPSNVSDKMGLEDLIELINRRFTGKPVPPSMPSAASRSIWNDISANQTSLPQLIRLLNRRLGGVRLPMTEDALVVVGDAPPQVFTDENFIMNGRHDNTFWRGSQYAYQVLVSSSNAWFTTLKRYGRFIGVTGGQRSLWLRNFIEPRAYGDPRYGAPGRDMIWRVRETIVNNVATGFSAATHNGMSEWGLAGGTATAATVISPYPYRPFIGFRAVLAYTVANLDLSMKWQTVVTDAAGAAILHTFNTGLESRDVVRDLMIEIDEKNNTINFYIDNALVDTYAPASDAWAGETGAGAALLAEWKLTYALLETSGSLTLSQIFHLAPGTPSLSYTVNTLP